ncbi:hypothetical protein BGX26_004264 [Mortierella sp. AD094]|nr:hypothetical protein BGX26_004264 [Mortierella sp. AD094]
MSSPISRTDSPTLDEHAKRKRDEALGKHSEGVLSNGAEVEADPEAVPPKKMQPEVDAGSVPVSKAEVKQIQRNLKTMPLEDTKSSSNAENENKDMDDVESQGSNEDQAQDKLMEESSQLPANKADTPNGESTPSSDIGDQDTESANTTAHSISNEKNSKEIKATPEQTTTSSIFGSKSAGSGITSSASPFASLTGDVFGSSSSDSKGFNTTSSDNTFSTAGKNNVFGSKSTSLSGGFGDTSAASPFASAAGTNVFGNDSPKSVFGQSSSTSATGFGASSENSTDSTAGSVFGARSIVGSVAGAAPSLQKPTAFPARLQSTSGSFSTFGSFSKEASFTSGSFMVDQDSSQDQDFGSLLSQDTGDHEDPEQAEGDENFGTGIFTNADQIDVHTGEEDEISIYQTKGKLYADTEKTHAWKERGKGAFKINISQKDTKMARLVMRTDGALRLILNVAIFPDMNVVITGDKYVRFIGIEEGKPISFLLKVKDAIVAKDIVDGIRRASERQSRGKGGFAVALKE